MKTSTTQARRFGEDLDQKSKHTAETQRCGEESGGRMIARDRVVGDTASICHSERAQVEPRETRASRRIPAMPVPANAASGSSHETNKDGEATDLYQRTNLSRAATGKNIWASASVLFKGVIHNVNAALYEIFDESAYDRFLLRTKASRSVASYHNFIHERDAAMAKKPRCC